MKLVGPFKQLVTMSAMPLRGALADSALEIIENSGIIFSDSKIHAVGKWEELKAFHSGEIEELDYDAVALPAFVDSHTHICYGGNRRRDYALRIAGKSYLEIAKAGGGIWDTVCKTREASEEQLVEGILSRVEKLIENGITTCEVKSGYGLSVKEELKILRAIRVANEKVAIDLIPTCLAAHLKPRDFSGTNKEYLEEMATVLLPEVKEQNLANRVDVFIEDSAFSPEEAIPYLQKAKDLGFQITIHGDQFTTGGSQVAVDLNAVSVDHLEASTENQLIQLAKSNVICTALPGASMGLGCDYTQARKLLDLNASVSIASDWNPGSAPMGDLLTQAAVISTYEKLSTAETLSGITFRACAALSLNDRGVLEKAYLADMNVFATDDFRDILYHQGQLKPSQVWKNGEKIKA